MRITADSMYKQPEALRKGIAAYREQQQYLLDWLNERGSATDLDFDEHFDEITQTQGADGVLRAVRREPRFTWALTGDAFIIGSLRQGFSEWSKMLELLHIMAVLDMVSIEADGERVVYRALTKTAKTAG